MSDDKLLHLESHIPQLSKFKETSSVLNGWWDAASVIARVNQDTLQGSGKILLESMQETKTQFIELQQQLNECLLRESFKKANMDLTFKSQNVIDVLTRNLFERTADVGFLATDGMIRDFMSDTGDVTKREIEQRLAEYVAKYSVYEEILLVKLDGQVLAHFDQTNPVGHCSTRIIQQLLASQEPYLERFEYSDFQPTKPKSHLFCALVEQNSEQGAPILGVLVMCFKLDDEMNRIFETLLTGSDESTLALLDQKHRVLVSSSEAEIRAGEAVNNFQQVLKDKRAILQLSSTRGYQGYMGLNWLGGITQPTQYAFQAEKVTKSTSEDYKLWQESQLVSNELKKINLDAQKLNRELRILTLNGKSVSHRLKAQAFMPILEKLQELGDAMGNAVSEVVREINQTALTNFKSNCMFYSNLAIELMDRNLYERANDCRWWALTPTFVDILSQSQCSSSDIEELDFQLKYINDLYTVYTNIFIYDDKGRIIAASNREQLPESVSGIAGKAWFQDCRNLRTSQQYSVSAFEPTELYQDESTYIYNAAIKNSHGGFIGGIGLVFDSTPEFSAMLTDSLPVTENGETIKSACALFINRYGQVISSTSEEWQVGQKLSLPTKVLNLANGDSLQDILFLNDAHYLAGATVSSGYREYKTTGDYNNDVIALVMIKM